jgi:hypothetical protein
VAQEKSLEIFRNPAMSLQTSRSMRSVRAYYDVYELSEDVKCMGRSVRIFVLCCTATYNHFEIGHRNIMAGGRTRISDAAKLLL